jgi:hypothetical protein
MNLVVKYRIYYYRTMETILDETSLMFMNFTEREMDDSLDYLQHRQNAQCKRRPVVSKCGRSRADQHAGGRFWQIWHSKV